MPPSDDEEIDYPESSWWSRLVVWSLQPRILATIAFAGLFVVIIPAFPSLWPSIRPQARFQMSADRIDLTASTQWTPHDIVAQVAAKHPGWGERNLLDTSLAADIAAAFAKHPWVVKVDRVEKTRQGRISVQVTYRTPVAMVETHRGLYPIDSEGVLLPPNDFSLTESNLLPHLRQVRSMPNGPAGTPWGDPVVVAGARLCAALMPKGTLESHWNRYGLVAVMAPVVDLTSATHSNDDSTGPVPLKFELLTKGGRSVIWGRPPGEDSLEPTVEQKLLRLDSYLRQFGSLDSPPDTVSINICGFDSIRRITSQNSDRESLR